MKRTPINPFRSAPMVHAFASCVQMYEVKHSNLFHANGVRNMGNSVASMFWRGFDGTSVGAGFNDRASRELLAYAYWKAGAAIAKAEK